MPQLLAIDSRLPATSATADDPTNPINVLKDLKKVENQTNADTRYDVQAKLREGFALNSSAKLYILLCGIILALLILVYPQPVAIRVGLGVAVIYAIHQLLGKLENHTV